MARDRLAGLRAQQAGGAGAPPPQGGYGGGPTSQPAYPPQQGYAPPPQQPQQQQGNYAAPPGIGGGEAYEMQPPQNGTGGMEAFFDEIRDIQDAIQTLQGRVSTIQSLHNQLLSLADATSPQHAQLSSELQSQSAETSRFTNNLKFRIKRLEQENANLPAGGDVNVRRTQVGAVKNKFLGVIQTYQKVEQESRSKYRSRMERQYKIVKPDATQEEIKQAIDNDGDQQVFSQALITSNRYGEARAALSDVQSRHRDIKQIEATMVELAQLFQEVNELVMRQDETMVAVEGNAATAENDVKQAEGQLQRAVKSALNARRARWICFIIVIIILIVVAIVVAVVVTNNKKS